jgi:UPF0716 protein FxsA
MALPALLLLFVVVPLAELYVIWQVGDWLGILPTLAILLADSVLGGVLMRSQGRAAWRRFNAATVEGRVPAREAIDGVLVIFGGAFLLTPGFLTDVFGLLLLLPPTRAVIRRLLVRRFAGRMVAAGGRAAASRMRGPFGGPPPRRPGGGFDVDGTAREGDPPTRLPRP